MSSTEGLNLLFSKPLEPVFTPRNGEVFEVPDNFLTDQYKNRGVEISSRFGEDNVKVPIRASANPQKLKFAEKIPRDKGFSLFNQDHKDIAGKLIGIFMEGSYDAFIANAAYAKDRINPYLFQYALAVAVAHRPDTKSFDPPSIIQQFPDQFVDPSIFPRLREEGNVIPAEGRRPIEIPQNYTASDREEEQRLAYFREDIGVNMHHWHWHLVYPGSGPPEVVRKDRRGELFFYMHNQIIARYNVERFANNLRKVIPLSNFREVLPEGYFPKIIRSNSNRSYPPRVSDSFLKDLDRNDLNTAVGDLERWRDRIFGAIDQGYVTRPDKSQVDLTGPTGIDVLGDIVEASDLTPNRQFYGSLHNEGHNLISFIHDPDNRHLEDYAVIGDVTTAMRDPLFYRWHAFIDNVFIKYKNTLDAYADPALQYDGVTVESVGVQITRSSATAPQNALLTFWQRSQVDLGAGLDFGPEGNIFAQFTHLQHAPFQYRLTVNNSGPQRRGTVRLFLFPRVDERGTVLPFRDQRLLGIEMDKWTVTLNPGANNITRRNDQSSITIPFERTFRAVGTAAQPSGADQLAQFQFCGCGWPQHMLLPKGRPDGQQFELFAMVSDFTEDSVNNPESTNLCDDAASFCGIRDRLYPDRRPMGYPFDRKSTSATLQEFVAKGTNMKLQRVTITHSNTLVPKS